MPETLVNPIKKRIAADELAIGMLIRLARSGEIARIAKTSDHDFLFIDIQHASYSLETISHITQVALGCGIAPLVRVRSVRDPDIAVVLDCGAMGIVFPDVNNADEARLAVDTCRFAPVGHRSLIIGHSIFDFRAVPPDDAIRILNENTVVVCMIETVEGLESVEEIAAVPGVDILLLGLTDLLYTMGKPGRLADPAVVQAVERTAAACRANGIALGVGGDSDPARQRRYIEMGARFAPLPADHFILLGAASAAAANLRAMHGESR
jgi:2-keto-3-deoxy-L-rhamnonate aldolase RhmA